MTKMMIMSLGGSPEPLRKSIEVHRPANIIFLASRDSIPLSGTILESLVIKPTKEFKITIMNRQTCGGILHE